MLCLVFFACSLITSISPFLTKRRSTKSLEMQAIANFVNQGEKPIKVPRMKKTIEAHIRRNISGTG